MMLLATILTIAQVTPAPTDGPAIVVTGRRMRDAYEKCLARQCPPEEEVDAAMNAASEDFAGGRYEAAKQTLLRTISRNKRYARRMPGRVSDLYATFADVAHHEGDDLLFENATRSSVGVLRDNLGSSHPATLAASGRVGDMLVTLGQSKVADQSYRSAARDAVAAGDTRLAALLTIRRASLALANEDTRGAARLLDEAEAGSAGDPRVGAVIRVLRARALIQRGDQKGADALLAQAGAIGDTPVLLSAPPYPPLDGGEGSSFLPNGQLDVSDKNRGGSNDPEDIRWADIGFWVRPDGTVADAEVLRPLKGSEWARPLLKQVTGRRYVARTADGPGSYRIERFTLRPSYQVATGSHVRARRGTPELQVIDLTRTAGRPSSQ